MSSYTSRIDTALAYLAGGDSVRAESLFRAVLAEAPDYAAAWHGLACVARHTGQPRLAIASVAHALGLTSRDDEKVQFHLTLAAALDEAGHLKEALAACQITILLEPRDFRAKTFKSELLYRAGRPEEASQLFGEAVALASDPIPLLLRQGTFLMEQRRFADAVRVFTDLVRHCPENAQALANLGAAFFERGEMKEAQTSLHKALSLGAPSAATLSNYGLVCQALGEFALALSAFDQALALQPDDPVLRVNRATFLTEIGRQREAETVFQAVMQESGAVSDKARFNLSMLELARGDYAQGWANFEARGVVLGLSSALPLWDGKATETPVRIEAEQGLGDMIQFLRFLPQAAARAPLVLALPDDVIALLALMPALKPHLASGRVRGEGEAALSCSLLSLPHRLGITRVDPAPYLDFGIATQPGHVGIYHAGRTTYRFDTRRSLSRMQIAPLEAVPGLTFVNLQQGEAPPDMLQGVGETLLETAKAMAGCELVIGVDTMLAHLAGASGTAFWLLDREGGDWRWQGPQWYATTRIFRPEGLRTPAEAWPPVISRVAQELRAFSGGDRR